MEPNAPHGVIYAPKMQREIDEHEKMIADHQALVRARLGGKPMPTKNEVRKPRYATP